MGKLFIPAVVLPATVAENEKVLSPDVTSPFVPLSTNCCVAELPIAVRSPVTVMPVLVGLAPGVTVTVSSVVPPAATVFGLAAPVPVGLVGAPQTLVDEA